MSLIAYPTYEVPAIAGASARRGWPVAAGRHSGGEARVLVVDDDASLRELIALVVGSGGNRPLCVASVPEALELLESERVDLVLTDLDMPGLGGLDLLAELSARRSSPPVLVISGCQDAATIRAASLLGALGVLEKPFSLKALRAAIDAALAPTPTLAAVA
jgi:DNA-binding NtrC family response regulator